MKNSKYIIEMLKRRSFPDFLTAMNFYTDPKEWTECYGMYRVILEELGNFKADILFDIGCGKRPTLGTLVALNISSIKDVFCVDPNLDTGYSKEVHNLTRYQTSLNEFYSVELPKLFPFKDNTNLIVEKAMVVCNHAHVKKKEIQMFLSKFKSWVYITNPCCTDNRLNSGRFIKDLNIWSPKNEIYVFKSV